jgi:hypothetical protein
MTINEYLAATREKREVSEYYLSPRVTCADGFSVSIQANTAAYCAPRDQYGPWHLLEAGFPSEHPGEEMMRHCEQPANPTQTVYGYVPAEVIDRMLESHGGIKCETVKA